MTNRYTDESSFRKVLKAKRLRSPTKGVSIDREKAVN